MKPEHWGASMSGFYGGRVECHIRDVALPVTYVDVTSTYPSVNARAGLWGLHTAATLRALDVTLPDARAVLEAMSLAECLTPEVWPRLAFFGQVLPQDDILPVRARYQTGSQAWSIGLNRLTWDRPLWYTGFDLAASILLTGRVPRLTRAFRIVPDGTLGTLQPTRVRNGPELDPRWENFFTWVVEERHRVRADLTHTKAQRDRIATVLKVIANSGAFGIYAQYDPRSLPPEATESVRVYDGQLAYDCPTTRPEDPGEYCFPPVAALITGAARLLMATLERLVLDAGGTYVGMDTDSMMIVAAPDGGLLPCPGGAERLPDGTSAVRALAWSQVHEIINRLDTLKPYGPVVKDPLLKLEGVNFDEGGRQRQLYGYMLAAKRYCLFTREGDEVIIRKASEHGLGALLNPADPEGKDVIEDETARWIADVWRRFVQEALGLPVDPEPAWFQYPAVTRFSFSSPPLLKPLMAKQANRSYADQVKPFNFVLGAQVAEAGHPPGVTPADCHLIGPHRRDPRDQLRTTWYDVHSGWRGRIRTEASTSPRVATVKSVADVVREYRQHPEAKSLGPDGNVCGPDTRGVLQRRHITPSFLDRVSKEGNMSEAVEHGEVTAWDEKITSYSRPGSDMWQAETLPALRRMKAEEIQAGTGLSLRTIYRARGTGEPGSRRTAACLTRFARAWLADQATAGPFDDRN